MHDLGALRSARQPNTIPYGVIAVRFDSMEHFVFNARRWPRVPAHYRVAITNRGIQWTAETEDVGPGGCQLVSPRVIAAGSEVRLAIATQALADRLSIVGRVAWVSPVPPIRLGIAFAQQLASMDPRAWFERLLQAEPSVAATIRRLPDRLPVSATLYLGQPPRFVIDFNSEELVILRVVKDGTRISDILTTAGIGVAAVSRAIFSLLARRALVLSRAEAVPASKWIGTLAKAESSQSAEQPAPAASTPAAAEREHVFGGGGDSSRSRMDARLERTGKSTAPEPKPEPKVVVASAPKAHRTAETQAAFEAAQRQIAAGGISAAIVLLRRALSLAPGDAEISALLGQLAFKDRNLVK